MVLALTGYYYLLLFKLQLSYSQFVIVEANYRTGPYRCNILHYYINATLFIILLLFSSTRQLEWTPQMQHFFQTGVSVGLKQDWEQWL
jgi:hypothetical protein